MAEFYSVIDQVIKNLLDLSNICIDVKGFFLKRKLEGNMFIPAQAAEGFYGLADDGVDIKISQFQIRSLVIEVVEGQQTLCELGQTVCLRENDIEVSFLHFWRNCSVQHGFHVTFD